MENMVITFLLCSLVIILTNMVIKFLKEKPSHTCSHDYNVIEVLRTSNTASLLSTCKKCGKQKTHWFNSSNY